MSRFGRGFATLAAGNLAGKFVAIGREVVFAGAFGSGDVASGFRVAQSASMVPANLISGDLLSAAFAPTYSRQVRAESGEDRATLTAYSIWLTVILSAVAGVVYFGREPIVAAMVPGLDTASSELAADFLAILSWAIPLYGISGVHSLALAARGKYISTSLRPVIQSLGLLVGTTAAIAFGWLPWLAVGFIIAWLAYTLFCFSILLRERSFGAVGVKEFAKSWQFFSVGVRTVVPLLPLPIFMQISIVLERLFSSLGDRGLVAAVDYARTVSDSVMSIVAVPLGILGLTSLSGIAPRSFRKKVAALSELVLIFVLPASILLVVYADPIVRILFQHGAFDDEARLLVVGVLLGHSAGLTFQVLGYTLSRALTADGRNRVVLLVTVSALTLQVVVQGFGVRFLGPFAIGLGPSVYGVVLTFGFALALGQVNRVVYCLLCLSPTLLIGLVIIFMHDASVILGILFVSAFALNVWFVPLLRRRVRRHLRPLISRWI